MRVALYHDLPPGGAFRAVREFLARRSDDIECDVFTLDFGDEDPYAVVDPGFARRDLSGLARQFRLSVAPSRLALGTEGLKNLGRIRRLRSAERAVARRINDGGYDVAFVHPCWLSQSPSILRDLDLPTVYFMQEARRASFEEGYADRARPQSLRGLPGWASAELVERTLRRRDLAAAPAATRVLANSRFAAATIEAAYGFAPTLAHLGVDTRVFAPQDRPDTLRPLALSVGGMEPFKGGHLVVEALAALPADVRPELAMVFERYVESYRQEVLELAARTGVVVHEHRGISDAELARLYSRATVTVLAAQLEPLGLVALESVACGTPVVAADEGGYRETIDDAKNGFLVDRSGAGLADGIARVLADPAAFEPQALRDSILPYWSLDEAVSRQEDQLRSVVGARAAS